MYIYIYISGGVRWCFKMKEAVLCIYIYQWRAVVF